MKHILILPSSYSSAYNPMSAPFFRDQAIALRRRGNLVGVLCPLPISLKKVFSNFMFSFTNKKYVDEGINTNIFTFPSIPKLFSLNSFIRFHLGKFLFKKYIKDFGLPDIIHVHNFFSGEIAVWIKEKYGIPFVVTEHSSSFLSKTLSQNQFNLAFKVFKASNLNLSVSDGFTDFLSNEFKLKFTTVPNLVDVNFFNLKDSIQNCDQFHFLNIGHLNENKNQLYLAKEFLNVFKGDKSKKLTIAGYGPSREKIKNYLNKNDIYHQVNIVDAPNREGVRNLFHKANCLVVSSRIETFSVVIIEALSCGIPVVSVKSVGPCSILTKDDYGILCDQNELGKSLIKMSDNRTFYKKDVLRDYVLDNYSDKIVSNCLQEIYTSVCDN